MAKNTTQSAEDVVRKEFPQFDVVQVPKSDARFLPADASTPDVKRLREKYDSRSASDGTLAEAAKPSTDKDVTEAVVIEPKTRSDRQTKRLTVLVKEGKIRAVQG